MTDQGKRSVIGRGGFVRMTVLKALAPPLGRLRLPDPGLNKMVPFSHYLFRGGGRSAFHLQDAGHASRFSHIACLGCKTYSYYLFS